MNIKHQEKILKKNYQMTNFMQKDSMNMKQSLSVTHENLQKSYKTIIKYITITYIKHEQTHELLQK